MNAEFQRIARRDKKAFFSNQCKEIEENNRMGKTTEDSIKAAIVYSTTKRKIIDSTTATLQLSSLKSNNESRRRKGKI